MLVGAGSCGGLRKNVPHALFARYRTAALGVLGDRSCVLSSSLPFFFKSTVPSRFVSPLFIFSDIFSVGERGIGGLAAVV